LLSLFFIFVIVVTTRHGFFCYFCRSLSELIRNLILRQKRKKRNFYIEKIEGKRDSCISGTSGTSDVRGTGDTSGTTKEITLVLQILDNYTTYRLGVFYQYSFDDGQIYYSFFNQFIGDHYHSSE